MFKLFGLGLLRIPSKEKFNKTVEEVLSKPEHIRLRGDYLSLGERIERYIKEWLERLINGVGYETRDIEPLSPEVLRGLMIIGIILIIIIAVFIILMAKGLIGKNRKTKTILGEVIDEKATVASIKNKSQKCKMGGNYREALRYDFIALLLGMNEIGIIYLDEAKTNREIIDALNKNKYDKTENFIRLSAIFNETWYGHKEMDEEKYNGWEEIINPLLSEVLKFEGS